MRLLFLLVMMGGALALQLLAADDAVLHVAMPEHECDWPKQLTRGEYDAILARLAGLDAAVKRLETHLPMLERWAQAEENEAATYWGFKFGSRLETLEARVQALAERPETPPAAQANDECSADDQILRSRVRGLEHQYMAVESLLKQQGLIVQKLQQETVQSITAVANKINEIYAVLKRASQEAAREL